MIACPTPYERPAPFGTVPTVGLTTGRVHNPPGLPLVITYRGDAMSSDLRDYDPFLAGVSRKALLEFAAVGIYPPLLVGNPRDPSTVQFVLAAQDRWWDPPCLLGTDEEGVERQRQDFEDEVQRGLSMLSESRDPTLWASYYRR